MRYNTSIVIIKDTKMILINSRFEYYNTFYNCVIGKNYVHNGKEECKPFVPKNKSIAYFKINGRLVSIKQVLNERYLVRMNAINKSLPDWYYD